MDQNNNENEKNISRFLTRMMNSSTCSQSHCSIHSYKVHEWIPTFCILQPVQTSWFVNYMNFDSVLIRADVFHCSISLVVKSKSYFWTRACVFVHWESWKPVKTLFSPHITFSLSTSQEWAVMAKGFLSTTGNSTRQRALIFRLPPHPPVARLLWWSTPQIAVS